VNVPQTAVYTRWTYRKLPHGMFAGALWQKERLVWQCEHAHAWQGSAKACARGHADRWPGGHRAMNGPDRVPSYQLPWLPDIRKPA
jgi:hypothetical protein